MKNVEIETALSKTVFFVLFRRDLPISTRYFTMNLVRQFCPRIRVFGMELENPCERYIHLVYSVFLSSIRFCIRIKKLFLVFSSLLLYLNLIKCGWIPSRHGTVPVFYWLPDSWQSICLSQGERVHQQFLKGLVRLRQERQIFKSWAHKYHIEFFYPSHIVTWTIWSPTNSLFFN